MNTNIQTQNSPSLQELETLFENCFREYEPEESNQEDGQSLNEWFSIKDMIDYLPYGELWEARDKEGQLIGATFAAKQNPISYPDGKKWELFILAVLPDSRHQGIATKLVHKAESSAKVCGAHSLVINTHYTLTSLHQFYQHLGYTKIGQLDNYYDNGHATFFKKELI